MPAIFLFAVLIFSSFTSAYAASNDWQQLQRIAQTARSQTLTGAYIHQVGSTLETFQLTRTGKGDMLQEKRSSLDGPSREIIRKGGELSCYAPDKKALITAKLSSMRLFPALLPEDMSGINQSYNLQHQGHDRVANRDCDLLELQPKDQQRYSMRLCVDTLTYLPLKIQIFSPSRETVELFAFTKVRLSASKDQKTYQPTLPHKLELRSSAALANQSTSLNKVISGLPAGFKLIRSVPRKLPGKTHAILHHLVFSDGLVMLSLFIEPALELATQERASNLHGAVNMVTSTQGNYQLTLVADMPGDALLSVIRQLKISNKQNS
ncbi:MucB/RseB C-terminal domain-containing protein [Neisseriaceae bacterium TC5R-5]|nr:MucB/RseB C-terminal domain-containing protein [Neisseriaceae bacterium TC5R-5]